MVEPTDVHEALNLGTTRFVRVQEPGSAVNRTARLTAELATVSAFVDAAENEVDPVQSVADLTLLHVEREVRVLDEQRLAVLLVGEKERFVDHGRSQRRQP